MQVLCKATDTPADIRCDVCGQNFLIYWTRTSAEEREACKPEILTSLRQQHAMDATPQAHPETAFNLPAWNGDPRFSAAALIGNAPAWATV